MLIDIHKIFMGYWQRKERTMSKKSGNYHVTPRSEGWAVKGEGAKRASEVLPTQKQAIDRSRELSISKGGGDVIIHGRDNRIRDRDTTTGGNDPCPPKDTK